jgi:hypothetical protein
MQVWVVQSNVGGLSDKFPTIGSASGPASGRPIATPASPLVVAPPLLVAPPPSMPLLPAFPPGFMVPELLALAEQPTAKAASNTAVAFMAEIERSMSSTGRNRSFFQHHLCRNRRPCPACR